MDLPPKIWGELSVIVFVFTAFLISAAVSPLSDKTNLTALFGNTVFFSITFICCVACYVRAKKKENKVHMEINTVIRSRKELIVTLILVALTRIGQLGTTPRWDSEDYVKAIMNACGNFDFTLSSYLQSFQLCSHTTLGYSLFLAIGEYLNPTDVYGINIINLILVLFSTYFIYEILKNIFPKRSKLTISMGTFLILVEPLACGTFGNINIDFPIMIFSIFIVFMHIRKYYLLFIFFACILVQSKEVGIVVVFGYGITYMLQLIVDKKEKRNYGGEQKKFNIKLMFQNVCRNKSIRIIFGACLLILLYALAIKNGSINSWSDGVQFGLSETNKSNYFAFVPSYIVMKLKMIFVMNFYWLFSILILMWGFLALFKHHKVYKTGREEDNALKGCGNENGSNWYPLISLGGGLAALLIFNCLYVTWSNPRYHYALEMGIFMTVTVLILSIIKDRRMQQILFLFLIILSLSQSYTTVDAVTAKAFETRSTGTYFPVAHPAWNASYNRYFPEGVLKDMAVYNNQLGYMDKAYNEILREVQYNEGMDIVVWDDNPKYNGFSTTSINTYWNLRTGRRTFNKSSESIPISMVYPGNIKKVQNSTGLKRQAVYIYTPSYGIEESVALEQLSAYYTIGRQQTVGVFMQGAVNYYKLEAKKK